MQNKMKQVQMCFDNELAAHLYSNSDYRVYSDALHPDEYEVRMQSDVMTKGTLQDMEDFFYGEAVDNMAVIAEEESDGRINCSDIDDFQRFTQALADYGHEWKMHPSTDWIIVSRDSGAASGMEVIKLNDMVTLPDYDGSWSVIDESNFGGKTVFLLENEIYGEDMPCIIVDAELNVILDDVYNGFLDLEEL